MYIYRAGKLRKIKDDIKSVDDLKSSGYFECYPDAIVCKGNPPSVQTMERWIENGIAKSIDGCKVEIDGTCPHNNPSWLIVLGYV